MGNRWRAFVRGAASIFDLGGCTPPDLLDLVPRSAREPGPLGDREALAGDWEAIGKDLGTAMAQLDKARDAGEAS